MMDLANCAVECLWADETFTLYRARRRDGAPPRLALVPRQATIRSLKLLENEFALAADLDPSWAVLPVELVPNRENMMLLLDDPGGLPLARLIERPPDLEARLSVAVGMADVVGKLHRNGLLHRDIKPANIFVSANRDALRLTGFGIAIHRTQEALLADAIVGTLPYIAPEQTGRMGRVVDRRSDLYSLGVTLYEWFTGSLPFTASGPEEWVHCHLVRTPPSPGERAPQLPEQLSAAVLKLMSKEPADRYQSAEGLAADLRECLSRWTARRRIRRFPLARSDVAPDLRIPHTLYGRAEERAVLRAAFDRVAETGRTAVVLIAGPSGVGKSALVAEFQSALPPDGALFGAGKFDVQKRDVPYAALSQAFGSLLRRILTYDDDKVAAWREILAEAVGPNGQLVAELIPGLDLVIGPQPALADSAPQDRAIRLRIALQRLVGAFAHPGRPLILFIDDLQWLDTATIEIVGDLVVRRDVPNLMLIAAYRANEVGPLHALTSRLGTIRAAGVPVEEIALDALSPADIAGLIADTLKCGPVRARPLAKLVHAKTAGNPFFATQFLRTLADEGLLAFDPQAGAWRWDIARVRAKRLAENVADLMAARLTLLPGSTQQALRIFAALGNAVELDDLAAAAGRPAQDVMASLRAALQAELITRNGKSYAFAHDRVQEAAYALQAAEDKPALHLRIGMALARRLGPDETGASLYLVADQLNRGASAAASKTERKRIVTVNLAAGRRARNAAAYDAAILYLETARALLGEKSAPGRSATAFAIALHRAECEFLVGHLDVAEAQLRALSRASPKLRTGAEVTRLLASLYTIRGELSRGVEVCLAFLRRVGIDWRPRPTDGDVHEERQRLLRAAAALSDDQLYALPPMTAPEHRTMMAVLADLIPPAGLIDRNLFDLATMAAARLTLQYGICGEACYPLVCVFGALAMRFDDMQAGIRLARLGAMLADRQPPQRSSGRTLMAFGHLITPWIQPIRDGRPIIQRGLKTSLAIGDLAFVAYSHRGLASTRLFCGDPLPEVLADVEEGLAFAEAAGFELPASAMRVQRELALGLMGRDEQNRFAIPGPTEPHALEDTRPIVAFFDHVAQIQINMLAGRHEVALALADHAKGLSWVAWAYPERVDHQFYTALAHADAHDASPPESRKRHLGELHRLHQDLTKRSAAAPTNFAARLTLLAAELARIEGRALEAEQLYEAAIRLARDAGFVQIEAIAGERAARFYEARGIRTVVLSYLANARLCYLRWGAGAKVRQLERANPHLSAADPMRTGTAETELPLRQLDVGALFRASRALSGEIELDTLIRTLMHVVIEHATAERGVLFLMRADRAEAVAEAHLAGRGIDVTVWDSVNWDAARWDAANRDVAFSRAALNYVVRTRRSLNSADPAGASLLSADLYLQQSPRISLHCLPIVTQAKLVGVLYLESRVAVGAFAPDRAAVLDVLAAQAAISLENARLYAELRRSEAFLAEGQRMSRSGSWSWEARTGRLLWSDEHYRICGIAPDRARPPSLRRTFRMVHAEDRAGLRLAIRGAIRSRMPFSGDYRLIRSDGMRHLHVAGRPELDGSGKLKGYIGTTIDMSDYRQAQEALQAAQADLAHASRLTAIGELTSLIAHEVRQPLTAIAAKAGACRYWLAHEPPKIAEAVEAATRIARDAHHASGVMESIRQMTRKSAPTRLPVDINDAITATVTLLGDEVRRQRVVLKLDLAGGIEPVLGDRVQLQQVVMNLMMNAIEAMAGVEEWPRLLSLSTRTAGSGGVVVSVSDAGTGLPGDERERLFEAFFTTKPNGLGVGLAICRSIIEAHDGTLQAAANHPRGSVFRFTLPSMASPPGHAS